MDTYAKKNIMAPLGSLIFMFFFYNLTDSLEQAKMDITHCCQLHWWTSCLYIQKYWHINIFLLRCFIEALNPSLLHFLSRSLALLLENQEDNEAIQLTNKPLKTKTGKCTIKQIINGAAIKQAYCAVCSILTNGCLKVHGGLRIFSCIFGDIRQGSFAWY